MAAESEIKTVNIRIPAELWATVKAIADEANLSFNKFTEEALVHEARERRRLKVRQAFAQLAKESPDIDRAFSPQAEAVLGE